MGKVNLPEDNFLKKVVLALLILVILISLASIGLFLQGLQAEESFSKALGIVTHVEIVNEQIGLKYFFALLSIMGGVVQFYLIYVILEYLLEGKFKDVFSGVRQMNKVKKMSNHYIIAGGGRVGSHAASVLKQYTKDIVIVDNDEETVKKLKKQGYIAVKGDVLDEDFLTEINIEKAKQLIACLGSDSDNILLVLTAKELHPGIKVSARANSENVVAKLKHAGAAHVVIPSYLGGIELAKTALRI